MKAQLKLADRARAAFGVVLARGEAERGTVAVKDMESGKQIEVPRDQVAGWIQARLEEPRFEKRR